MTTQQRQTMASGPLHSESRLSCSSTTCCPCHGADPTTIVVLIAVLMISIVLVSIKKQWNKRSHRKKTHPSSSSHRLSLLESWWKKRQFVPLQEDDDDLSKKEQGTPLLTQSKGSICKFQEGFLCSMDSVIAQDQSNDDDDDATVPISNVPLVSMPRFKDHLSFLQCKLNPDVRQQDKVKDNDNDNQNLGILPV